MTQLPEDVFTKSPLYAVLFDYSQDPESPYTPYVEAPVGAGGIFGVDDPVTVPHGLSREMASALPGLWYCVHLPNIFPQLIDMPFQSLKDSQRFSLDHQMFFAPVQIFNATYIKDWPPWVLPTLALSHDDIFDKVRRNARKLGFALPAVPYSELSDDSLKAHRRAIHSYFAPMTPYLGYELTLTRRLDLSPTSLPARWLACQIAHDSTEDVTEDQVQLIRLAQFYQTAITYYARRPIVASMSTSPAWSDWPESGRLGCIRCFIAPSSDQLALFDMPPDPSVRVGEVMNGSSVLATRSLTHWPRLETSACGRPGFWRPRTRAIFGVRSGVGPLLVFPDTAILISLHQGLEEAGAFTLRPLWSDRRDPVDALRDLIQLWWYRDVRFRVSPTHLKDAAPGRPMTLHQELVRRAAVRELDQDFHERGGYEPRVRDVPIEDQPCALHSVPVRSTADPTVLSTDPPLPRRGRDKQLVYEALEEECHVFLTADRKILRCHRYFMNQGLAILSPAQVLEELDASGELDDYDTPVISPIPDITALARFHGAFASECFEERESG